MAKAFISGVDAVVLQEKTVDITENGTVEIIPDDGKLLRKVTAKIDTPIPKEEQEKNLTVTKDGTYRVLPDEGKVLSAVNVEVDTPDKKEEQEKVIEINGNGTIDILPDTGKVLKRVTAVVNVEGGSDAPDTPDIPDAPATPEYSEGLEYEYDGLYLGGYIATDYGTWDGEHLVIPPIYNGEYGEFEVVGLGYYAFEDNPRVKSVTLPETIWDIGNRIFNNCPSLTHLYMPYVTQLASLCIYIDSLKYVQFKDIEMIGGGNFSGTDTVYDFTACTSVPSFDSYGLGSEFGTNPTILVPDALLSEWETATNWAIYSDYITSPSNANTQKKTVTYEANGVYDILPDAGKLLRGVKVFVSISSESQGLAYHNYWEDGVYVSGYGDWDGEHLVIPSEYTDWSGTYPVTGFDWGALNDNSKIRSVTLPSSLTWLKGVDFYNCPKLTHIYMPDVSMIDSICMGGESFEYVQFRDMGTIGGNVFTGCKYCVFDFTDCSAIPTLDSYGAASEFGINPIIRVPASLLDEWRSATNWTLYAAYIVAGA